MIDDAIRSLPNPYPRTDPRGDAWAEGVGTAAREARRLAALPNREAAPENFGPPLLPDPEAGCKFPRPHRHNFLGPHPNREPTPDTPESELTGDGLRAAQAELSAAWATLENDVLHPGDFAPQIAELFRVGRRGVEAAYTRLAALPNREAAPTRHDEFIDTDALNEEFRDRARINGSYVPDALRPNREAAPREGLDAVRADVARLRATIGGPLDPSHAQAKANALDAVLAIIDDRLGR